MVITTTGNYGSHHWTGQIEILGSRVIYREIHSVPGITIDAIFYVEPKRFVLELIQKADNEIPVLEAESWRLVWALQCRIAGVAAVPILRPGRSGEVQFPTMFASDGVGCLSCQALEGDEEMIHLQVESYRLSKEVTAGFVLGTRPNSDACMVVSAEKIQATVELVVDNLQPVRHTDAAKPGLGIRRHWASNFSCYRPERGGFSNHSASVNCHVNQHGQMEVGAFTAKTKSGFNPLDIARFTVERALMDGSGYGYWRNL